MSDGGTDARPGDGPAAADKRLQPIEVGRTWTYDVVSTYPSCPGGERETRIVGTGTVDGRSTFRVAGYCGFEAHVSVDGDRVDSYYDWGPTGWYRQTESPVADGATWTTTNGSATFTQTYHVAPATGGYSDCWKVVQNVGYTQDWIYCRGVGLVSTTMVDLAGGTIRATLKRKNF
jgi:hypothetical protein